jgi:hypothetical protein
MSRFYPLVVFLMVSTRLLAGGPLSSAWVKELDLMGNDIVFDRTRNVFYMSVPSLAGLPYGNCIVTIHPETGEIIGSKFVGSEPNRLAISSDASRVYVGLDGAYGFSWWEPASDTVGPLVTLTGRIFAGPYVAEDLAVAPDDSHTVVVSKNEVFSTAGGEIEVYRDTNSVFGLNQIYGAESIAFTDNNTLVGYDNLTSGNDLWKWNNSGTNLTETARVSISLGSKIKAANGLIFSDAGKVLSASNLSITGTLSGVPYSSVLAPVADEDIVYFLGTENFGSVVLQLSSFSKTSFLKFDSKTFTNLATSTLRSLVVAKGEGFAGERLGYVQTYANAGIISIPPPVFRIEGFESDGAVSRLRWSSVVGNLYRVQRSTDLTNWTTFATNLANRYDTTNTFPSVNNGAGREFYRVMQE